MKAIFALALAVLLISFRASAGDLRPFLRGSWQELRHEHSGRPMVVHFWGVTCGPCLVELPQWAALIGERPGVDIVLIAADPVVEEPGVLAATLSKTGCSAAESWMFADSFTERLTYEVDPQWAGELPYTLLVASDSSVSKILGTVNFSDIRSWAKRQVDQVARD